MTPEHFTRRAQQLGLSYRGVSLNAVQVLQGMLSAPIPMVQQYSGRHPVGNNDCGRAVGPLIRNGLARLKDDRTAYEITSKGREYLAALKKANLLPNFPLTSAEGSHVKAGS